MKLAGFFQRCSQPPSSAALFLWACFQIVLEAYGLCSASRYSSCNGYHVSQRADSVFFLLILGIGFGLGYGGIFPVYAVIIREYMPPKEAGRRTGIVFLFGAIAMGIGSWMGVLSSM